MQAPTHILAGMIIKRAYDWRSYRFFSALLTIVTALLLHGIFDKLGRVAYDPQQIDFTDPFWLIYHVFVWLVSLVMLYMFWAEYKLGIFFSLLPDLDYIIIHTADAFGKEVIFYKEPWIHNAINLIIDNVIPFSYLNLLPDQRSYPLASIWEIVFFAFLVLVFSLQLNRRRNIHF
jgi:hypothetical protein